MALIDISSLLLKQANPEQQALIQKLNIPANQVLSHNEFIELVVRPIMELQGIVVNLHNGEDGKSAFQIAQDEGFSGTLSEWLESLKGPKGDSGIQIEGSLVISQTTGSSDSSVMSQDAVTKELQKKASAQDVNDLAQKIIALENRINELHGGNSGGGSGDTPPENPPIESFDYFEGQTGGRSSEFSSLSKDELVAVSTKYSTTNSETGDKSKNATDKIFFIMIPSSASVKKFIYTSDGSVSDINGESAYNVSHSNVTINGKEYKIFGYRDATTTASNPLLYTYNIKFK